MFKIYLTYLKIHIKSLMQYKMSFILTAIGQAFSSMFSLLAIYFLFEKFGDIQGYTFEDVLICFVISYLGFSISECFFRGFDNFSSIISNAEFDRILVRPIGIILQVLGTKIEFVKIGRAILAIVVFIALFYYCPYLLSVDKIITMFFMIIGTVVIFSSLHILKAGLTFFTIQSLELMNIFTDGGRDLAQYPLNIYKKWVLNFFTFVLPLSMVNYYPLLYVIEKSNNILYVFAPFTSLLFILPCYLVWKLGVKKYQSVGS
ncbi:MAG: ABC-2 family transporter protein [Clostridia bacterium]|nr:ABC-2 family transporter protein [Clostridia bacterium]MDD4387056.1 ABC-2 family transporter protein [Clostridia bacterium]